MNPRLLVFYILFFPVAVISAEETEIQGRYLALIVSDVDGSSSRYQAALGLEEQ